MPIYEYECRSCARTFEHLSRSGEGAASCPRCGAAKPVKRFASFAVSSSMSSPCEGGACAPSDCAPSGGACGRFS